MSSAELSSDNGLELGQAPKNIFQGKHLSGHQKHPPHEARELHHILHARVSLSYQTQIVNANLLCPLVARSSVT